MVCLSRQTVWVSATSCSTCHSNSGNHNVNGYTHLPPGGCTLTISGLHPLLQGNLFLCSLQTVSHSSEFFFQLPHLIRHGRLLSLQSLSLDHLCLELSTMKLETIIYCRNTPLSEKKTESLQKPGLWTWPWTEILKIHLCALRCVVPTNHFQARLSWHPVTSAYGAIPRTQSTDVQVGCC